MNLSKADLTGATLTGADLRESDLRYTQMHVAHLERTNLRSANLSYADLSDAYLNEADLNRAILYHADLSAAELVNADLSTTDLRMADLRVADLSYANLSHTDLSDANISNAKLNFAHLIESRIYAISAWNIETEGIVQEGLIITDELDQSEITVDNLEIAQFIYLLLNNKSIRHAIDTITSKVVLILGRFTHQRKQILDALRVKLRQHNYIPVLFDFEKPTSRDLTETVSTLAHIARFVLADITEAKSIPQELERIVPHLPSVPVQPLLQISDQEYSMFEHFTRFPWVLPIYHYTDQDSLLQTLGTNIIEPAEQKARELTRR